MMRKHKKEKDERKGEHKMQNWNMTNEKIGNV